MRGKFFPPDLPDLPPSLAPDSDLKDKLEVILLFFTGSLYDVEALSVPRLEQGRGECTRPEGSMVRF